MRLVKRVAHGVKFHFIAVSDAGLVGDHIVCGPQMSVVCIWVWFESRQAVAWVMGDHDAC